MICPYCSNPETQVVDKRDKEGITKRRRECLKCGKRFNTIEKFEDVRLRVIKKDGSIEEFDREKVRKGIERACEKRPVGHEKIEMMLSKIEDKLRKMGKEVKSTSIGEIVSKELKKVDKVAYIRFASVYREFADIGDFKKEIKEISK
jgi:transcriptional repressor NrdR